MSQALTLARPYARAVFAIARDANALPAWSEALTFAARIAVDPRMHAVLGNPKLTSADAIALLSPQDGTETFGNFLSLLFDNRRLPLLPEIAGQVDAMRFEADRVVKAKVTTAAALPASELDAIKAALTRRFGREVEVETAIDESLIGGALIDAGDVVIDGTLKGKLGRLQAALAH